MQVFCNYRLTPPPSQYYEVCNCETSLHARLLSFKRFSDTRDIFHYSGDSWRVCRWGVCLILANADQAQSDFEESQTYKVCTFYRLGITCTLRRSLDKTFLMLRMGTIFPMTLFYPLTEGNLNRVHVI